jgi:Rieske 2Fe-2S family protein
VPSLTLADLELVQRPLAEARPLPGCAYVDPAVFEHERRAIFDRSWHCVGLARDVEAPGAWVRTPLAEETLVVVRGEDLVLRALYDACRHRGAPVFEGESGRARAFTCGYHGWVYDARGALREAPFAHPAHLASPARDRDRDRCGLRAARVDVFAGLLFATVDPDAPPLAEAMGEVPPWLPRAALPLAKIAHRAQWLVAANWKLVVENFQESHHFVRVHPLLESRTPSERARSWLGPPAAGADPGAWLGGIMPIRDADETVSLTGRLDGRPLLAAPEDARLVHDATMFPLLLTSLQPDYLLLYRLEPRGPSQTLVRHELLVHPAAEGSLRDVLDFWARVHDEDRAVCEQQQRVMRGGGYASIGYATCEDGVHAFDVRVARALARALSGDTCQELP